VAGLALLKPSTLLELQTADEIFATMQHTTSALLSKWLDFHGGKQVELSYPLCLVSELVEQCCNLVCIYLAVTFRIQLVKRPPQVVSFALLGKTLLQKSIK
jgi:hypothetical protein